MYFALVNGQRRPASPGAAGVCELCGGDVFAKTGRIRRWHFAHANRTGDCDSWYEPETEWHSTWKSYFPDDWRERVVVRDGVRHRADVLTSRGVVLEFQHSIIAVDDMHAREQFWGRDLMWVFDLREPYEAGRLKLLPETKKQPSAWNSDPQFFYRIYWTYPRKSIGMSTAWQARNDHRYGVYFDVGDDYLYALQAFSMRSDNKAGGWCDRFLKRERVRKWGGFIPEPLPWEQQRLPLAEAHA